MAVALLTLVRLPQPLPHASPSVVVFDRILFSNCSRAVAVDERVCDSMVVERRQNREISCVRPSVLPSAETAKTSRSKGSLAQLWHRIRLRELPYSMVYLGYAITLLTGFFLTFMIMVTIARFQSREQDESAVASTRCLLLRVAVY